MKKIEIILISKAFNGFLNNVGMSVYGDGYIRKTILKRELQYPEEGDARTFEINHICRDVTGSFPTRNQRSWRKGKDSYSVKINDRLSFLILVDK